MNPSGCRLQGPLTVDYNLATLTVYLRPLHLAENEARKAHVNRCNAVKRQGCREDPSW